MVSWLPVVYRFHYILLSDRFKCPYWTTKTDVVRFSFVKRCRRRHLRPGKCGTFNRGRNVSHRKSLSIYSGRIYSGYEPFSSEHRVSRPTRGTCSLCVRIGDKSVKVKNGKPIWGTRTGKLFVTDLKIGGCVESDTNSCERIWLRPIGIAAGRSISEATENIHTMARCIRFDCSFTCKTDRI